MRFPTYLKLGLALVLLPATAMAGTACIVIRGGFR